MGVSRTVRAHVAAFSLKGPRGTPAKRALANGGRAYVVEHGELIELEGDRKRTIVPVAEVPITIAGLATHNVANALAAAGAARGLGATLAQVGDGLRDFKPSSERSPGRLNLFKLGSRVVIVDFAHNEAGIAAILDVAEGIAGGAAGRAAKITAIIGTAGDRPDDTLRGIGRIAGQRAQRVAIKETPKYLRGRTRESIVGELLAGVRASGRSIDRHPRVPQRDGGTPQRAHRDRRVGRGRGQARRAAGHRPDVPRGARGGLQAPVVPGCPPGRRQQ